MLQKGKRTYSLNLNDAEIERLNPIISEIQNENSEVKDVKTLFLFLLDNFSSPESTVEIPESNTISIENNDHYLEIEKTLPEFKEMHGIPNETELFEVLDFAVKLGMKAPEIIEIEKEVEKQVPISLESNQIIIDLTDDPKQPVSKKLELLEVIRERRQIKYKLPEKEPVSKIIEGMVFNEGSIFNVNGDFHTGF